MTSRGFICLRTVAASLAALPVMAPLKPPQAAGVPAACRSSCAREYIQRFSAKTQRELSPFDVRFGSKADIAGVRSMSALPPKADIGTQPRCPLCAMCGRLRVGKENLHVAG